MIYKLLCSCVHLVVALNFGYQTASFISHLLSEHLTNEGTCIKWNYLYLNDK